MPSQFNLSEIGLRVVENYPGMGGFTTIVATKDEKEIGCVSYSISNSCDELKIELLSVYEGFRGQGYSKSLILAAMIHTCTDETKYVSAEIMSLRSLKAFEGIFGVSKRKFSSVETERGRIDREELLNSLPDIAVEDECGALFGCRYKTLFPYGAKQKMLISQLKEKIKIAPACVEEEAELYGYCMNF